MLLAKIIILLSLFKIVVKSFLTYNVSHILINISHTMLSKGFRLPFQPRKVITEIVFGMCDAFNCSHRVSPYYIVRFC